MRTPKTNTTKHTGYIDMRFVKSLNVGMSGMGSAEVPLSSLGGGVVGCLLVMDNQTEHTSAEIVYELDRI